MNKFVSSLFCISLGLAAQCQQSQFRRTHAPSQRYWLLTTGLSSQTMYDEAISPTRYNNSGLGVSLDFVKTSEKTYREFLLEPTFVKLKAKTTSDLRPVEVNTTRVVANYRYLRKVKAWNDNVRLYAGGIVDLLFNFKRAPQLDNSQVVYDYALSLGASAKLDKDFRWRQRTCRLSYELSIPIVSHLARPYYLNRIEFIDPQNNFLNDLFKNSSIASFNKFIRATSGISITYPLFNRNALKLMYKWDFYKLHTIDNVYAAEHFISIAFMSNY